MYRYARRCFNSVLENCGIHKNCCKEQRHTKKLWKTFSTGRSDSGLFVINRSVPEGMEKNKKKLVYMASLLSLLKMFARSG